MRAIILALVVFFSGCTTLDHYQMASKELLDKQGKYAWSCWRKPGPYKEHAFIPGVALNPYDDCDDIAAKPSVDSCIWELTKKATRKPRIPAAKEELLECMQEHGWELYDYLTITN